GVFEGIRCYQCHDGRSAVFRLREHIDRLYGSAHVLELAVPYPRERLVDACLETVRANRLRECYLRPIVFMGDGEMGLAARPPTRVAVAAWPWGAYLGDEGMKNGIRVKTSSFARLHPNTLLTKSKATGHYVNSILASREPRAACRTSSSPWFAGARSATAPGSRTSRSATRDSCLGSEPDASVKGQYHAPPACRGWRSQRGMRGTRE